MKQKLLACFAAAALLLGMSACTNEDNPSSGQEEETVVAPAQLKQGIWTEYDEALLTSGKYTEEQLAQLPSVGMQIDGDKASFFTYTADDVSEPVEGKISYDSNTGKGSITFPTIKDNPLSGQTVSFTATTDEKMEFEITYEGQKTKATCVWLCENTDNWGLEITNEEWEELMGYYKTVAADWGPDSSIDWGDLAEPLTWDETPKANNRAVVAAVLEGISTGIDIFSSLFEPDPNEVINAKLDALLGKVDEILKNQQLMNLKLDEINSRLIDIATHLQMTETLNKFNDRNEKFYNKLKVQNNAHFNDAFKLYDANKNDLSKVSDQLGAYGKKWVGTNKEYINLTWEYIEFLTSVQHSKYGKGMDKIYDGITFEKYPWEHMGIGDRKNYRAFDLIMIARSLFMIGLYAQYGGLDDLDKKGICNNFEEYKKQLKDFCMFEIANPDKFVVCQLPGAHFVMHKELQKYNYSKKQPDFFYADDVYKAEWHEAGSIKIENPLDLKSKLISRDEAKIIYDYYQKEIYPKENDFWWMKIMVDGNKSAGAVYSKKPGVSGPVMMLSGMYCQMDGARDCRMYNVWMHSNGGTSTTVGVPQVLGYGWNKWYGDEFYAAIIAQRF
jgi:hypothetical protein